MKLLPGDVVRLIAAPALVVLGIASSIGSGGGGGGGSGGGGSSASCVKASPISTNATVNGSLASGDCTLDALFPGQGFDESLADQYVIALADRGELEIRMTSAQIDPLLVLLKSPIELPEIAANDNDDSGTLNASITLVLEAGSYIILANSGGDAIVTGTYTLTTSFTPSIWTPTSLVNAPESRSRHTAVWSGTEMLVWGGDGGNTLAKNSGARLDPADNSWRAMTTAGAPAARFRHTAVWTGTEMIVWGGTTGGPAFSVLGDGARYNPQTNTWTPVSSVNAPSARVDHTAVWTGTEMIVWGGAACGDPCSSQVNTGGRYNPATDTWTPVSMAGAPAARIQHTAVWTGSKMIVWGGAANGFNSQFEVLGSGGAYDPVMDSWTSTSAAGAPAPSNCHSATWSGTEMLVVSCDVGSKSGYRYDPVLDNWSPMSAAPPVLVSPPVPAVWTGNQLIIWSARAGARYNPANDSWNGVSTADAPPDRSNHTLVWTGSEMISWGGTFAGPLNDGGIYRPDLDPTP